MPQTVKEAKVKGAMWHGGQNFNLYLYKIESLNLVIVCVADANAKHDISYTTGFSMFRRWMLAHYIGDFVSVVLINPRKSYALI